MKYMGYAIEQTNITTTVHVKNSRGFYSERLAYLYKIHDLKEPGKRPFLTSIEQCKEYIRLHGHLEE